MFLILKIYKISDYWVWKVKMFLMHEFHNLETTVCEIMTHH